LSATLRAEFGEEARRSADAGRQDASDRATIDALLAP